ncbi:MAG: collagen binding domain-containing protein [Anaerolineae bacterium]
MKRRYIFVVMMVVGLLLLSGVSTLAEPARPPRPRRGPAVRIGAAWGAIVQDRAAAHNFVRPAPENARTFTVMRGTTVRLIAGASGLWLGEPGGTLSADLEVYAVDEQGAMTLLGEDHVSDTRAGPAFEQHSLKVPVSFDQPGEIHLLVRLATTAEAQGGDIDQDVDELEAIVIVLDPSTFGSISGQVTANDTGAGLEGLPIIAGNRDLLIRRATRTDADGNYTIENLPPGDYIVGVQAKGTAYLGEVYDDVRSPDEATPVTVVESADTPGIDFGLDRGAEVSGGVTDQDTGEPLAGIPIMIRPVPPAEDASVVPAAPAFAPQGPRPPRLQDRQGRRGEPGPADRRHRRPHPAAVTTDDGTYTVQGLPAGEYIVAAVGIPQGYGIQFWQEAPTPEEATPITVELGQSVPDIDFTLEPRSR